MQSPLLPKSLTFGTQQVNVMHSGLAKWGWLCGKRNEEPDLLRSNYFCREISVNPRQLPWARKQQSTRGKSTPACDGHKCSKEHYVHEKGALLKKGRALLHIGMVLR